MKDLKIAYFGGEPIGVPVLEELEEAGILPSLIVCNPDRPVGRKQVLTPPPTKEWALEHNIEILQPEIINNQNEFYRRLTSVDSWDLFIVVAYNKILPEWLIGLPKHKTLNVHPSLLPLLRGASPIRSAILEDMRKTGVTIMQMDKKMDHGPIVAQEIFEVPEDQWPISGNELDAILARIGGTLLAKVVPDWISGNITPTEQKHEEATFCGKMEKADGELVVDPRDLPSDDEAYQILLKIKAYDGWPGTFFFHDGKRIKIIDAEITDGKLHITHIIPAGKKEIDFDTYFQ